MIKSSADLDKLVYYTWITGTETVLGYAAAIVLAVPLGLAIAFSSFLRQTIYPFFVSIEMTPKIAFAPLFISWLGFGLLPKVIIVFLVCFFPIVLNAILAFGSLSEELTRFCRATGAGAWRSFVKVRLPAAMPQCFVGFKYAAINATVGATIAEFIGSDQGLGFYIQIVTGNMRPDLAFAGIFFLTVLGLAVFGLVTLAERAAHTVAHLGAEDRLMNDRSPESTPWAGVRIGPAPGVRRPDAVRCNPRTPRRVNGSTRKRFTGSPPARSPPSACRRTRRRWSRTAWWRPISTATPPTDSRCWPNTWPRSSPARWRWTACPRCSRPAAHPRAGTGGAFPGSGSPRVP